MRVSFSKYPTVMLLAILLEMAAASPVWSQDGQKLPLTRSDYGRWGKVSLDKVSSHGRYISFTMRYPGNIDTLFVKDTKGGAMLCFTGGRNGTFADERYFVHHGPDRKLSIEGLGGRKSYAISNVENYKLIPAIGMLIYTASESGRRYLALKPLDGEVKAKIWDVHEYVYNDSTGDLACSRNESGLFELVLVRVKQGISRKVLVPGSAGEISNLTWETSGKGIAFIKSQPDDDHLSSICYFDIGSGSVSVLEPHREAGFPEGWKISRTVNPGLKVSAGGEWVFFSIEHSGDSGSKMDTVQVWNAADKYLYPVSRRKDGGVKYSKLAVWQPKAMHFEVINDNVYSEVMLAGDGRYAILIAPDKNEPQWNYDAPKDYALYDISSGKKSVLLERQSTEWDHIATSPGSWHIAYFSKGDWWLYDLRAARHINVTAGLGSGFTREHMDVTSGAVALGQGGWLDGDGAFLFYDEHDVWMYHTRTGLCRRLTRGKEEGLRYRVAPPGDGATGNVANYAGQESRQLATDEIFLEVSGRGQSGFCLFSFSKGCTARLVKDRKISGMAKGARSESIAYIEQDFDSPPAIMLSSGNRIRKIFQSNPHHFAYEWGKSELVAYRNSKGRELDAALYYPAGYTSGTKYPMIIYIYDTQSHKVHNYVQPSLRNSNGFNIANYTSKGYFVLVPDIAYEVGSPGFSATDCVVSAAYEVLAKGSVDSARIGLVGHSFGGYETDFIITQTGLFAAAVSGAAITDLPSSYLYTAWNYSKPNFWHYEYNQLRMGNSLFDNYLGYISNSPVYHAAKVQTPLLSWTGEEDRQVHYYQSIEFYLALRRLEKEHVMLIYPGQGHALSDPKAQVDLTLRVEQWFDRHLKGGGKQRWMEADLPR